MTHEQALRKALEGQSYLVNYHRDGDKGAHKFLSGGALYWLRTAGTPLTTRKEVLALQRAAKRLLDEMVRNTFDPQPHRVALWNAVNAYAVTCGADVSDRTMGGARMNAVVAVERAVEAWVAEAKTKSAAIG